MRESRARLMVTGLSGFVGTYLCKEFSTEQPAGFDLICPDLAFDLRSPDSLRDYINICSPDAVIHLAGQTNVPVSFQNPESTYDINFLGTLNLLKALKEQSFCGRFIYVSSGDVYGLMKPEELPVCEARVPRPRNPYAVSKASAELLCLQWSICEKLDVLIARPFNHIGRGQAPAFALPAFAQQIARIKLGKQPPVIQVGDIDVTRDFLHVNDVLRAYLLLLANGKSGEIYNICSGREFLVRELLEQMINIAGIEVSLQVGNDRLRPAEQRRVRGDNAKLENGTGWQARIEMAATLEEIVNDWIERESNE